MNFDVQAVPSPSYVVDEKLLIANLEKMKFVTDQTGCKILLAQKGFSMFAVYPLIGQYLHGVTSSGVFEARLGFEEMGKEVHTYAPAFQENEFEEILRYSDHLVFNSFAQWKQFKSQVQKQEKSIECGIRINPEYSEIEVDMYNPCFTYSRFGVTLDNFEADELEGISGLHFHTMCEQNSDTLWRTIQIIDEEFGPHLQKMKWINFGGGHHITRADYDLETLIRCIRFMQDKYNLDVYLEPGEAVALNTGFLVSTVLDTMHNGMDIAILDTSASCHMPDVLEMPYRPEIIGAGMPNEKAHTYRLGGPTCLAGDVIGDYSFDQPLQPGDRLVFCDMAHYSMVKNNTFNGVNLPSIVLHTANDEINVVKQFGYEDFRQRLS
ncbi:carboxynorspermidine decarboxylase [Sporosarcina sp. P21c]|uniref:carboxynorspermidine decarboxylase n=1 Tax=unclassified Sporosarcina TaxID=2647733 RepID=UPI000C16FE11|nr:MULTISPECIES: carboxynorspermidine decarboxylase [unclassified Sporosarcina]PIC66040.1 carboxynorspermidine decarboxylase [Sporosarcina sp. P16a]PIC82598.1 carboxynorspermidine decarboxylase [Sporosarcina sp. P1]PIC89191.1 carboxynorspermidine decarboxylase [Sporosarcina sp. P21c]PIC92260.1 carboxynorspermidine decarboxylase [Sporosarcina sp. P25]